MSSLALSSELQTSISNCPTWQFYKKACKMKSLLFPVGLFQGLLSYATSIVHMAIQNL